MSQPKNTFNFLIETDVEAALHVMRTSQLKQIHLSFELDEIANSPLVKANSPRS